MSARDVVLFVIRALGFALLTAMGGWAVVPLTAALWSTLATAERRRDFHLALAAAAGWGLLLAWGTTHGGTARAAALLSGIFAMGGTRGPAPWMFVLLTLAIAALLAWSAAVVVGTLTRGIAGRVARSRETR
ncbi:MAG TPA: hypothetical protein VHM67_15960 [Gemmatimonadaceae bacterium]|nr:hypothetical protein [Gemmatimonadaceae bacterium]